MTTVADVIGILESMAPLSLSASWDNSGLQLGRRDQPVKKIMVALDPSPPVILHAVEESVDMLVTHHPLFFDPIKSIDLKTPTGGAIGAAIRNSLTIYAAHTNLDAASDGLNHSLAQKIGLLNLSALEKSEFSTPDAPVGLGRVGTLPAPLSVAELGLKLKESLQLKNIRLIGNPRLTVSRVALCTGSGSSLLDLFYASGAEVYITGDLRYHDARKVEEKGLCVIDMGHFASEHIVVHELSSRLAHRLAAMALGTVVVPCGVEQDPFIVL
jgi:GTP cyclohydrolase I